MMNINIKELVKRAYKSVSRHYRWLERNGVRQDDADRELRQDIICWNLPEDVELRLMEFFAVD